MTGGVATDGMATGLATLPSRFAEDLAACALPGTDRDGASHDVHALARRVLSRYDEPARRYHTREHLAEMFAALDHLDGSDPAHVDGQVDGQGDRLAVRLAVWFHDAVYDPTAPAGANERDSAQLAVDSLQSLNTSKELVDTVSALVLATADHRADDERLAATSATLLDADLWILAAPPERFDAYCAQVRAEYAFVPAATYATARSAILRDLLDRPRLYATARAHDEWTPAARANVARELTRLAD